MLLNKKIFYVIIISCHVSFSQQLELMSFNGGLRNHKSFQDSRDKIQLWPEKLNHFKTYFDVLQVSFKYTLH